MAVLLGTACSESRGSNTNESRVVNQPLESYQQDLLELAFETASKLLLMPHIKNRARAQEHWPRKSTGPRSQ